MSGNERLGIELVLEQVTIPNDPFAALTSAVGKLQESLNKIDWSKIGKGLDEVNKKSQDMEKTAKSTQGAVEQQINSIAKRMEAVLGVSAEAVKKSLKTAFQFEGVEQGLGKLSKIKDMMVEVQGKTYSLNQEMARIAKGGTSQLTTLLAPGAGIEYTIFSKKKLQEQVESFKSELLKIKEFADKNLLNPGLRLTDLQRSTSTFFNNKNVDNQSFARLDELRSKAKALQDDMSKGVKFTALDSQVDKLVKKFGELAGSSAFEKLKSLSSANFDTSTRGIAQYGREVSKLRTELEDLAKVQRQSSGSGTTLQALGVKQGRAIADNDALKVQYAAYAGKDADGAYQAYLANIRKQQEDHGNQLLAIIRNTRTAEKAERDKSIQDWQQYQAALGNSGQKFYNGSVVPKTFVTNIADARAQAISEDARRGLAKIDQALLNIKARSSETKITVDVVTEAFKRFGVSLAGLKDSEISRVNDKLRQFNVVVHQSSGAVETLKNSTSVWSKIFGESIGKMAARLTEFYSLRTIIFAVGSQFREALTASIKFSQNIHDIAAISGATKKEMNELGGSIWDIARSSRFTADEVANLVQLLAQAGVAASDLPTVAASVGRFATATGSKPEQAADLVTTSLNVFDKKAEDTAEITNVLTAALNESKLTTDGLATAFNYLAPQAEQLGMSLEQTAGIIATMAQAGIKPSTIGTGTSQLIKELSAPKGRLSALLDYYKIKQEDVDPIKNSFAEIVATFQNATGKMGEQGVQTQHIMRALETRTARSLVTAISLGSEAFERMTTSITGTNAAWVAYYKSMDGAEAKFNVIKQNFQSAINGVLGSFSGVINGAATALTGFTNMMNTTAGQVILVTTTVAGLTVGVVALTAALRSMEVVQLALAAARSTWIVGLIAANPVIAGLVVGLGALTAAYSAFGGESNRVEREVESFNKTLFTSMEAIDKSAAGIRNAKQVMADGKEQYVLNEYEKAVKKYGETSDEVNKIKQKGVQVTDNTSVALNKLKADYPEYFGKLEIEGKTVKGLIEAYEALNKSRQLKDEEARAKYNTEIAPELKRRSQRVVELQAEAPEDGNKLRELIARKRLESEQKSLEDFKKKVQPTVDMLKGAYTVNTETVAAGSASTSFISSFGDKIKPVEEEKVTIKPIVASKGVDSSVKAANTFDLDMKEEQVKQDKIALQTILEELKDKELTGKEVLEKQAKIDDLLSKLYGKDGRSGSMGEQVRTKVTKEYEGKNYNNKQREEYTKKRLDTELALQQKEFAKYRTDFKNTESDAVKAFEAEVSKIKDDAAKRQVDADKKRLELQFKNLEGNAEERVTAYYDYLTSVYEKNAQKYEADRNKLDKEFSKIPKPTEAQRSKYVGAINQTYAAQADADSKAKTETTSFSLSAMESQMAKKEKEYDTELRHIQTTIALKKQQAWSADEVRQLEIQAAQAEADNLQKKQTVYATTLKTVEGLKLRKSMGDALVVDEEALVTKALDFETKLKEINDQWDAQKAKIKEISDLSFSGNFMQGVRDSLKSMGDFASMTKQLGSDLTNSLTNGLASSMSNSFTALVNPDTAKINELNAKITDLKTQKAQLEADISTIDRNTDKTPEELKNLQDKKVALQNVTAELNTQEQAVRKQKDAWQTFSDGLKGIMTGILKELQNYIFKLLAVWAVQKLVGLVGGMFGGGDAPTPGSAPLSAMEAAQATGGGRFALGGLVKGYAEGGLVNGISGGLIPESLGISGKDSVPILAMPEEYIIPADVVRKWGAGHFENYRNGTFKKMAEGGLVGAGSSSSKASSTGGVNDKEIHLHLTQYSIADPRSVPQPTADDILQVVSFSANSRSEMYRVIKNVVAS